MKLAPVILFTYNRPIHTAKVIKALAANQLAKQSELYVFSDGPKNEIDIDEVQKVRIVLEDIEGFAKTFIRIRDNNLGLAKSIIEGITDVFEHSSKVIVMEDDLVTAPGFLNYMNVMLQAYEDNEKIFSISGFNYPRHTMKINPDYPYDVYYSPRPSSWGWGTWKNCWELADWGREVFKDLNRDKKRAKAFSLGGDDLIKLLRLKADEVIDSWAVLWSYTLFEQEGLCVYPVTSYVQNIGFDDLATHTVGKDKYHHDILNQKTENFIFPDSIEVNPFILKAFQKVFRKKIIYKIYDWIKGHS